MLLDEIIYHLWRDRVPKVQLIDLTMQWELDGKRFAFAIYEFSKNPLANKHHLESAKSINMMWYGNYEITAEALKLIGLNGYVYEIKLPRDSFLRLNAIATMNMLDTYYVVENISELGYTIKPDMQCSRLRGFITEMMLRKLGGDTTSKLGVIHGYLDMVVEFVESVFNANFERYPKCMNKMLDFSARIPDLKYVTTAIIESTGIYKDPELLLVTSSDKLVGYVTGELGRDFMATDWRNKLGELIDNKIRSVVL